MYYILHLKIKLARDKKTFRSKEEKYIYDTVL